MQEFFCLRAKFLAQVSRNGYASVVVALVERLARRLGARR
jgi:hypothetical protein